MWEDKFGVGGRVLYYHYDMTFALQRFFLLCPSACVGLMLGVFLFAFCIVCANLGARVSDEDLCVCRFV